MNMLLETYGKTLIACIIGSIVLLFTLSLKDTYYREIYPEHNNSSIVDMYNVDSFGASEENKPIIKIEEQLTIKRNDARYDLRPYKENKAIESGVEMDTDSGIVVGTMNEYKNILNNYKAFATTERTAYDDTPTELLVFGADEVDVSNEGTVYTLLFVAKNDLGHFTEKTVYVLID